MAVTYEKLRTKISEKGIQFKDLVEAGVCCWQTVSNINHDKYLTLQSLEKIAIYLDCEIGDIVGIKKTLP